MAETSVRDAKLIQYLNDAYGKEKELETSLQSHIGVASRKPYKKRLQDHLKETRNHARLVERRMKKLGGASLVQTATAKGAEAVSRGAALAKGPVQTVRGTGEAEIQLKNAITEHSEEGEEIARYTAIETLAASVGDRETAQMARQIRREEERMAAFLARQIPPLTKQVVRETIPRAERNGGRRRAAKRVTAARSRGTPSSRGASRSTSKPRGRAGSSGRTGARSRPRARKRS